MHPPNDHPLGLFVRQLEGRFALSPADREAVLALPHKLRALDHSAYIVREGDRPGQCAVLVSGFAFRQKSTRVGARQIVSLHIPGDALDLQNLFLGVSDHSVQMLTRGEVADVPREAMQEIVRSRPGVGEALLVMTLVEASIFREWVLNIGRRDSRSRIAHLLCEFAMRLEAQGLAEDNSWELPMTQEQIADATGLTAVHVNRVLKQLQADGLIHRDRRRLTFPDWRRMREEADFNQRYLHLDHIELG